MADRTHSPRTSRPCKLVQNLGGRFDRMQLRNGRAFYRLTGGVSTPVGVGRIWLEVSLPTLCDLMRLNEPAHVFYTRDGRSAGTLIGVGFLRRARAAGARPTTAASDRPSASASNSG
jgi:hypothetical protein